VAEENILPDDLLSQLISIGEIDILVGLHTYNNAKTVGHIVQVIREGLLRYFPRERAAVVNADGGSLDGSPDLVRAASISDMRNSSPFQTLRTLHCVSSQYADSPSPGHALHIIVAAADLLRAKACAVISPEASAIEPDWIDRLVRPLYRQQADYVTPAYRRHRFEGMLVTNLMYPMTRTLYGDALREPHPSEFAFSDRLGSRLMGHSMWSQDAGRFGPEVCITIEALAENLPVVQTFLGLKNRAEQQASDLVAALRQTVGPLFWSMEQAEGSWAAARDGHSFTVAGPPFEIDPDGVNVDASRLFQMFSSGVKDLESVLKSIVQPATLSELQQAASLPEDQFSLSDELWVKVVYEFAAAHRHSVMSRDHIVQALAPLYRGRAYTFLKENLDVAPDQLEQRIEALCLTFERFKPYLTALWTAPEGGRNG
jgi:hypothetical protein